MLNNRKKLDFSEFCENIMNEKSLLTNIASSYVEEVNEYSKEKILDFIHDIDICNPIVFDNKKIKFNFDLKCNLDIPHKGRIKLIIYLYNEKENDDINILTLINELQSLLDIWDINEDKQYNILKVYSFWVIQTNGHIKILKSVIKCNLKK